MDLDPTNKMIFTGSGEGEVKAWKVDHSQLTDEFSASADGQVSWKR